MDKIVTLKPTPKIDFETVMRLMHCNPDNPIYNEVSDEYDRIYGEASSLIEPFGILGFGTLTEKTATSEYPIGTRVIYAVTSIGNALSQRSSKAFSEGDYIKGMLFDSIADSALFSLDRSIQSELRTLCDKTGLGIVKSLEAPNAVPIEIYKEAYQNLSLDKNSKIKLTNSFMLDPVKSMCKIFVVCTDKNAFNAQHNCRTCPNLNCHMRCVTPIEITVLKDGIREKFLLNENVSLWDGLIKNEFYINAPCGGNGLCGKCKVKVLEGNAAIHKSDKLFFTQNELNDGYRLSCTMYPTENLTLELCQDDEFSFSAITAQPATTVIQSDKGNEYKIAIDIGTTTIAFALLNDSGDICISSSRVNKQRRYGADVVSRITAATQGKSQQLRESIQSDLAEGITSLCDDFGASHTQLSHIAISANTTMTHLLLGYDCKSLGKYPFTPVNIDFINGSAAEIIGLDCCAKVTILPGISAYVGGDIVSGLFECGFDKTDDICLFIDLGTNGEIALGNRNKILVTSTAVGPAFEGCNISCGTGSIAGAISSAEIANNKVNIRTIYDKPPIGICGTGVIELTSELLKAGLIDKTGLFNDDYFDNGFPIAKDQNGKNINFTQNDIRELQLAKSAVYAGVKTLLMRYNISANKVSNVYIAGGFGQKLNMNKAAKIKMLPDEFLPLAKPVGNSSLMGAIKYLNNTYCNDALKNIVKVSKEITLSTDNDFADLFINSMMF